MADKINCLPACAPNVAGNLPVKADADCCTDPAFVPSVVTTDLCDGAVERPVTATMEMVLASGTVIYTRRCPDEFEFDSGVLCDPSDGTRVVWVVNYDNAGVPTTKFYTLTGAAFTGDATELRECEVDLESDGLNWCYNGQEVTQWIVKSNGRPDGQVYWTGQDGSVIAEPTVGPNLFKGSCAVSLDTETAEACFTTTDGETTAGILQVNQFNEDGDLVNTYYQDQNGNVVNATTFLGGGFITLGECQPTDTQVDCIESQEWTYGIDNLGTVYNDVATYEITLSDGTKLFYSQSGASTGWTQQLIEWANGIQASANDAGLAWYVLPRFIDDTNPSNLDGTIGGPGGTPSGLPGAASTVVAEALFAGGMSWRYVNIQICPGQPVPVSARRLTSTLFATPVVDLTTAGPILGPLQRFFVCRACGDEPVWYLDDGVTEAGAGQIPNCYLPCGFLSLQDSPPGRTCDFVFDLGCDSNDFEDTVDFTSGITRRLTVCDGVVTTVSYFIVDPTDPSSTLPYTLIGDFVECSSGLPIAEPVPPCAETTYVGKLYQITDEIEIGTNIDWWAPISFPNGSSAAPHGNVSGIFSNDGSTLAHVNGAPDVSFTSPFFSTITASPSFLASVGAASSAETSGTDQLRLSGYIVLKSPAVLLDTNTNTGERGAIYVNTCCSGDLELLFERNTDTIDGQVGVFEGVKLPAGIHYVEAITSDMSAWQGLELSVSFDDGATYEPFLSYTTKPAYTCVPVIRCESTGILLNAETGDLIVSGPFDSWCEPKGCPDCCVTPEQELFDGNVVDVTPNPDQTHTVVSGTNTSIPAGFKSVTINSLTGTTTINGGFQLGGGRRVTSVSYNATEVERARGLLPAFTLVGGTWQWTALSPIEEV